MGPLELKVRLEPLEQLEQLERLERQGQLEQMDHPVKEFQPAGQLDRY
jgi:hypothetical protein